MTLSMREMPSPLGQLRLVAKDGALVAILWPDDAPRRVPLGPMGREGNVALLDAAQAQLHEYFAGVRRIFDLPLHFGGTAFQQAVWSALRAIPYGEMRSYAEIACAIDRPAAVRAVGAANGRNPLSIIAPCHRVIATNGALTGFAGGLAAKTYLLRLEQGITTPP